MMVSNLILDKDMNSIQYNPVLKTIEIRYYSDNIGKGNEEEFNYFWKKKDNKRIINIIKKYITCGNIEILSFSGAFCHNSLIIKCWDVNILVISSISPTKWKSFLGEKIKYPQIENAANEVEEYIKGL